MAQEIRIGIDYFGNEMDITHFTDKFGNNINLGDVVLVSNCNPSPVMYSVVAYYSVQRILLKNPEIPGSLTMDPKRVIKLDREILKHAMLFKLSYKNTEK